MLTIRLQRVGRKHEPKFRVVLTDSKNGPKSGKFLEVLGHFDSRIENKVTQFKVDEIKKYMANGAKLSDTVHNFLVKNKVITGKAVNNLPKRTPIKKELTPEEKAAEEAKANPAPKVEAPVETTVEAPAETPAA